MSGVIDLPLVMLQKAQHAAEAAAASAKLFESEVGHRLTSIEARMVGVEGRLTALAAGQSVHELSLMRIADTQSEHTARFDAIDQRFDATDKRLDAIDKRFDAIDRALTNILGKLP
jgi:hypothetical protein